VTANPPKQPLPLAAVRALALHTQALTTPPGTEPAPTPDAIHSTVEQLTCIQIDTLQVVQRSQYLVLWSRLGCYQPADIDRLIYDENDRRLFEYWRHAASIIPLAEYRYHLPAMRWYREHGSRWNEKWLAIPANRELTEAVLDRIRREGPLRVADFEHDGERRDSWWDWKPAKRALEVLYNRGELMIADRVNFQRVYNLAKRVLPDWVDTTEPTRDETRRYLLERALRALGISAPGQVADYAYMKRGTARPYIKALMDEGVFVAVQAELMDGTTHHLIVHRDNLAALAQSADGALGADRTTFLSPFDNLFWARGRDQQLWGFRQVLECYKPPAKRQWGYFCLPILHKDRLVGRFDPKLERQTGTLRVEALYLEKGVAPDDELVIDMAGAMRDFMAFHTARDLVIERSEPADFGEKLLAVL
jgi:uncharacterized protein YcaQ